jgi:hypothetical protein
MLGLSARAQDSPHSGDQADNDRRQTRAVVASSAGRNEPRPTFIAPLSVSRTSAPWTSKTQEPRGHVLVSQHDGVRVHVDVTRNHRACPSFTTGRQLSGSVPGVWIVSRKASQSPPDLVTSEPDWYCLPIRAHRVPDTGIRTNRLEFGDALLECIDRVLRPRRDDTSESALGVN